MRSIERAYLACATPRSGNTLLCELPTGTGVAGRPAESFETLRSTGLPRQPRQYFEALDDPAGLDFLPPLDPGTPETAFDAGAVLREGTTPNGVFGAKVMWTHLPDFLARVRHADLPGLAGGARVPADGRDARARG
jgi:LPS sulfotransferase NodH